VWAFEAADRLACVHATRGTFDVDLSLAAIEASFGTALVRVHRNWLVNIAHIRELDGTELLVADGLRVPVARERAAAVRELLLESSAGVRRR
jgi:two-component system response regulator LytT